MTPHSKRGAILAALALILAGSIPAAAVSGYLAREQARSDFEGRTVDLIQGCHHANAVREVVFRNTTNAIEQSTAADDPTRITNAFKENLAILTSGPNVDPDTGLTRCEAAYR